MGFKKTCRTVAYRVNCSRTSYFSVTSKKEGDDEDHDNWEQFLFVEGSRSV